jgi:hypothetical protein
MNFAHHTVLLDEIIAEHIFRLKNQLLASVAHCTCNDNCAARLCPVRKSDIIDGHSAVIIIPCPYPLPEPQLLNVEECEKLYNATKELLVNTVVSEVGASEHSMTFTTLMEHYNQCTLPNCPPCTTLKRLFIERQSTIFQELGAVISFKRSNKKR